MGDNDPTARARLLATLGVELTFTEADLLRARAAIEARELLGQALGTARELGLTHLERRAVELLASR